MKALLTYFAIGSLFFLTTSCDSFGGTYKGKKKTAPTPAEVLTHCCSSGAPVGYIQINDTWSPTTCGGSGTTSNVRNVCTYQRFDNKQLGSQMTICNGEMPEGWVKIDDIKNPTKCGGASTFANMMTIKKVN